MADYTSTGSSPLACGRAANVVLWAALASTSILVGGYFLVRVYRHLDADLAVAVFELVGRTAVLTSAGLALEGLLDGEPAGAMGKGRWIALQAVWAGAMLLCFCLWMDIAIFAFAGYHLTTGARILLSGGLRAVRQSIEAVGVAPWMIAAGVLAAGTAVAAAAYLARLTGRFSARAVRITVKRRTAFQALLLSVAAIGALEVVSYDVRNPWLWEREMRSVPLAFSIVRPEADLASFRVSLRRPPPAQERAAAVAVRSPEAKPDVFIFMIESLRKDAVNPALMPRLSAFAADAWTFEHPVTTGNATHYSWYGLFCAEPPIFYDAAKASPAEHGSVPLTVLRRLGYRIHLFATPNLAYQGIQDVVFGDGGSLLDTRFHPESQDVAERDRAVVAEFARIVAAQPRGGGVFVVALDSTHFDYSWGAGFDPPYKPIAARTFALRDDVDAWTREALRNRYRDAVAWMDLLLGQALDAIRASGRMGSSYVIVTGDHGEAFWEHGSGTHGTDLSREQVEVGFAMKVPGAKPRHFDGVFSLLDVMPTVLHRVGFRQARAFEGVPVQARLLSGGGMAGPLAARAALTFQGVNERAYRFALTTRDERLLFELDQRDPLASRRLSLKRVTDLADASLVDGEAPDAAGVYDQLLRQMPRIMDELPFFARETR